MSVSSAYFDCFIHKATEQALKYSLTTRESTLDKFISSHLLNVGTHRHMPVFVHALGRRTQTSSKENEGALDVVGVRPGQICFQNELSDETN